MPNGARLEKLTIENFAGIRHLEMDVSPFTVLIGPQSVGKSVTAKVVYFFKSLPHTLYNATLRDEVVDCEQAITKDFLELFSDRGFAEKESILGWSGGSRYEIQIKLGLDGLVVSLPDSLRNAYDLLRESRRTALNIQDATEPDFQSRWEGDRRYWHTVEEVIPAAAQWANFIPAGRSFYAQIERDAASFYTSAHIDPFVSRFGKLLARLKIQKSWSQVHSNTGASVEVVNKLLGGIYLRENNEDWILSADGRRLPSVVWSSGQQEAHPLTVILRCHCDEILSPSILFIEEPEAHLFPTSQRLMTELIVMAFKAQSPDTSVFLTTHSPYILTTINNLLQAGMLYEGEASDERKKALAIIVPQDRALASGSVGVFYMDRDSCHSIMDEETGLIGTSEIDKASWDLSEQFEALLETQPS